MRVGKSKKGQNPNMVKVEATKDYGKLVKGKQYKSSKNSAELLVKKGVAKLVETKKAEDK